MNLANPSGGTILDRLSILSLKILHGTEAGKDVSHFQTERTALLEKIRGRHWMPTVLELAVVNAALWHAEDELRTLRRETAAGVSHPLESFREVACLIQSLNDRRAALIAQIDAEAGEPSAPEKL